MNIFNFNLFFAILLIGNNAYCAENGNINLSLSLGNQENTIDFNMDGLFSEVSFDFDTMYAYQTRLGEYPYYKKRLGTGEYWDYFKSTASNIPDSQVSCNLTVRSENNWKIPYSDNEYYNKLFYSLRASQRDKITREDISVIVAGYDGGSEKTLSIETANNSCEFDTAIRILIFTNEIPFSYRPENGGYTDTITFTFSTT